MSRRHRTIDGYDVHGIFFFLLLILEHERTDFD